MLKGVCAACKSLVLSGVGVLLLLCAGPQLRWLSPAGLRAQLGCTMWCSCWCAGHSGLKPGAAQLSQCEAVLQRLSCPSQPGLADRAVPLSVPLLLYFLLT